MSLDGYIASSSGGIEWISGDGSDEEANGSYPNFIQNISDIIMGYKTYKQIIAELSPHSWPYPNQHTHIITHRVLPNQDHLTFTSNLALLISTLKTQKGKHIWICGGADIAQQVLQSNLVDELCISVIPKLLGEGIKLFDSISCSLYLVSTQSYNGIVDLRYRLTK